MFLDRLSKSHRLKQKLFLRLVRVIFGAEPVDVLKALLYRPEFFGTPHAAFHQSIMRSSEEWTDTELEVIAAVVSDRNRCRFCCAIHRSVAEAGEARDIMGSVLEDLATAPISERLRAALELVGALTEDPESVTDESIEAARGAGLSDDAIEEALYVSFMFNVMNRLMSAVGGSIPTAKQLKSTAKALWSRGYEVV